MNAHLTDLGVPLQWESFSSWYHLPLPTDLRYAPLLFAHLRLRGIHAWENRPCFLSAAHTAEDIDRVVTAFAESVNEMVRAGLLPGDAKKIPEPPVPSLAPATPAPSAPEPASEPTPDESFPLTDPQVEILL